MTREEAVNRFKGIRESFSVSIAQSKFYPSKVILNELCDMAIEALSADRPTGWISVSEKLPSDGGNYLITVADLRLGHNGEHTVTMADFYPKAKKWNSIVDVYAWMPLPEPYKGGEEE